MSGNNQNLSDFVSKNPAFGKKIWLIAIVLFVVLVGIAFYGGSQPSPASQPVSAPTPLSSTTPSPSPAPAVSDSAALPIPQNNPNVQVILDRPASIRYLFVGVIKELKNESAGTRVLFVDHSPALPALVLTKDTVVKKVISPGKFENASLGDLKPGFNVNLGVDYNKSAKQWLTPVKEAYFNPR